MASVKRAQAAAVGNATIPAASGTAQKKKHAGAGKQAASTGQATAGTSTARAGAPATDAAGAAGAAQQPPQNPTPLSFLFDIPITQELPSVASIIAKGGGPNAKEQAAAAAAAAPKPGADALTSLEGGGAADQAGAQDKQGRKSTKTKQSGSNTLQVSQPKKKIEVKHQAASGSQKKVIQDVISTVVSEGKKKHLSAAEIKKAATVAVMTITQESNAQNMGSGDADSVGAFQQRPSMGWGKPGSVVEDTKQFLNGIPGHGGLFSVLKRGGSLASMAQAVQASADGSLYSQWGSEAANTVAAYLGGSKQSK